MIIAYWIVGGLAALVFFGAGVNKVARSREGLVAAGMTYAEDFSRTQNKLIGVAELAGAVGLILPMLTGIAPILSPIAGVALGVIMIGAVATHIRRSEPFIVALVLAVLGFAIASLGFLVLFG